VSADRHGHGRLEGDRPDQGSRLDAGSSSSEHWEEAAPGWVRRQEQIRAFGAPVAHWMVQAIGPQPGQRVLELAAGLGEPGMLAAELVAPVGGVVISDQAEGMLEGARARAADLGLTNIEFQVLGAEWIDLPVASVDAVLCRWGYMLMDDPLAALLETRRVLRPGGRVALAVWDALASNPWAQLPAAELGERGLLQLAGDGAPGPFALGNTERVQELLEEAGFTEIVLDAIPVERRSPTFEDFWEETLDISRNFHDTVLGRPETEIIEIRAGLARRLETYMGEDGSLAIPGVSLVAAASA